MNRILITKHKGNKTQKNYLNKNFMSSFLRVYLTNILLLICCGLPVFGQEIDPSIEKQTFTFAQKDTSKLKLDKYRLKETEGQQPCVFFVFGGGFTNGERDRKGYHNYFNFLAKSGFTVISIDYRLGLAGEKHGIGVTNYKPLQNAINLAVSDLFSATEFALKNAESWQIDTSKFIISGSSAGAITVMQAEYENRNKYPSSDLLPHSFQYAGVISFAGAIFRTDGGLKWQQKPCPILLFHGDADKIVPYKQIRFFKLGFFGSQKIVDSLRDNHFPYWFLSFKGASHEIATDPMDERQPEILEFIHRFVLNNEQTQIDMYLNEFGKIKASNAQSYKDLY